MYNVNHSYPYLTVETLPSSFALVAVVVAAFALKFGSVAAFAAAYFQLPFQHSFQQHSLHSSPSPVVLLAPLDLPSLLAPVLIARSTAF